MPRRTAIEFAPRVTLHGRVLTAAGDLHLAWDELLLFRHDAHGKDRCVASQRLEQGRFTLTAQAPGVYTLLLTRQGWKSTWNQAIDGLRCRWDVELFPGDRELDLVLEP